MFLIGAPSDFALGRYTAAATGAHLVSTQLGVEDADIGTFRVVIALNGLPDSQSGLHVADSHPDPNFADFSVRDPQHASGRLRLRGHAHEDTSYSVSGQSGFSCVRGDDGGLWSGPGFRSAGRCDGLDGGG